jgi:hypothetical protein
MTVPGGSFMTPSLHESYGFVNVPELRRNSGTGSKQDSRHDENATVRYLDKQELLSSSETAFSSEGEIIATY